MAALGSSAEALLALGRDVLKDGTEELCAVAQGTIARMGQD